MRKKILWLVSWYPNRNDRFDGDFIQRHARAAAIYNDVHVIFVTDSGIEKQIEEEWNYATGLTEQIIYFRKNAGWVGKLKKQFTWRRLFQKAIESYIGKNGLPDVVHVQVPWKAGLMAVWLKKKYGKEFIITEHWGIYNRVAEGNFHIQPKLVQTFLKQIFSKAKEFVTVSRFLAAGVESIFGKKATTIIPNVVDTTLFFYKDQKYPRFTFIHVSNMVPLKNVKGILDAFHELSKKRSDIQLILIGNRTNEYVVYAESLGLLNTLVFFKGEISYRDVAETMQQCHCLVLNSTIENSPCVIGEALCCGLPVIATAVGGIPELISKPNGMLTASGEQGSLIKAMEDMLNLYPTFNRKQIAEESAGKFGYSTIAGQFSELYQAL